MARCFALCLLVVLVAATEAGYRSGSALFGYRDTTIVVLLALSFGSQRRLGNAVRSCAPARAPR